MFNQGDLVLMMRHPMVTHKSKGNFQSRREGSFVIKLVYSIGAYCIAKSDSETLMVLVNDKF